MPYQFLELTARILRAHTNKVQSIPSIKMTTLTYSAGPGTQLREGRVPLTLNFSTRRANVSSDRRGLARTLVNPMHAVTMLSRKPDEWAMGSRVRRTSSTSGPWQTLRKEIQVHELLYQRAFLSYVYLTVVSPVLYVQ